jgi:hypothetical protein
MRLGSPILLVLLASALRTVEAATARSDRYSGATSWPAIEAGLFYRIDHRIAIGLTGGYHFIGTAGVSCATSEYAFCPTGLVTRLVEMSMGVTPIGDQTHPFVTAAGGLYSFRGRYVDRDSRVARSLQPHPDYCPGWSAGVGIEDASARWSPRFEVRIHALATGDDAPIARGWVAILEASIGVGFP